MHYQAASVILTSLLSARVLGSVAGDAQPGVNVARQQDDAACTEGITSVLGAFPSGTGDIVNYMNSVLATGTGSGAVDPTYACQVVGALPSSVQSEFSAYESSLTSWLYDQGSRIDSLVASCTNDSQVSSLASVTSAINAYASGCNNTSSAGGGGSSNVSTTTETTTASSGEASGASSTEGGGGGGVGVGGSGGQSTGNGGASGSTAGAGTQTGSAAGSSPSVTGVTTAGSPSSKDTGFLIGAAAIAGVMGVVSIFEIFLILPYLPVDGSYI
jgi:hypothetical protein